MRLSGTLMMSRATPGRFREIHRIEIELLGGGSIQKLRFQRGRAVGSTSQPRVKRTIAVVGGLYRWTSAAGCQSLVSLSWLLSLPESQLQFIAPTTSSAKAAYRLCREMRCPHNRTRFTARPIVRIGGLRDSQSGLDLHFPFSPAGYPPLRLAQETRLRRSAQWSKIIKT